MKSVEFYEVPRNRSFQCWRGKCIKTGDREAMDASGTKFPINPRDQVEVQVQGKDTQ